MSQPCGRVVSKAERSRAPRAAQGRGCRKAFGFREHRVGLPGRDLVAESGREAVGGKPGVSERGGCHGRTREFGRALAPPSTAAAGLAVSRRSATVS